MFDPQVMNDRLASFLAAREPTWRDIRVLNYEVMTGGYSRLLARADVRWTTESGDHAGAMVLRGDPTPEKQLIVTDRRQEFEVLRVVSGHCVVSPPLYLDEHGEHLMTPTVVLGHVGSRSLLPHLAGRDDNRDLVNALAAASASFHRLPLTDLPDLLPRPADWDTYMTQRIGEWRQTALEHVESLPIMRYVGAWLDAHRPPPVPLGLVHGDYQSTNMMLTDDDQIIVLDWELAHIGDPREDIGYFRAVAQAAPPDLIAADEEAFCARYRELMGYTEAQLNPAVIAYFLVAGVVGTVRQLAQGGSAYARGENTLLQSLFSMSSLMFGQMMWLQATEGLEAAFAAAEGAS